MYFACKSQREQKCRGGCLLGAAQGCGLQSTDSVRKLFAFNQVNMCYVVTWTSSLLPFLSLPSSLLVCQASIVLLNHCRSYCHHVPESNFKGLDDQKISTKEKNFAMQLQREILCTRHTGSKVFREPSWGKKTNTFFHFKFSIGGKFSILVGLAIIFKHNRSK